MLNSARYKALSFLAALFLLLAAASPVCFAAPKSSSDPFMNTPSFGSITDNGLTWRSSATGFRVIIEDDIDLLTSAEERKLLDDMIPLTEYGNVAFWSTRENASNELVQAEAKRRALFDLESASIFVINMNLRKVSIQSYGTLYDVITSSRASTITNNVRNDLTRGEYYKASSTAFSQMNSLMRGNRIAQPMKLISNICISLMIGLLLMLSCVFRYASTFQRPRVSQIVGATALAYTAGAMIHKGTRRTYSPRDDDSSSGSSVGGSFSSGGSSYTGGGGSSSF